MIDRPRKRERRPVSRAGFVVIAFVIARWPRETPFDLLAAGSPPAADPRFAERQVEYDSSDRQCEHGGNPGDPGGGLAMRAKERANDRRRVGNDDDTCADLFTRHDR